MALFGIELDWQEAWPLLLAAVPAGLLIIAAINAWLSARNERRRTQPVVICHEHSPRTFSSRVGEWVAEAYLTNEGAGPAFNVRFGLGVRALFFPWRIHQFPWRARRTEGRPSRQRVVASGARVPASDGEVFPILIPSVETAELVIRRRLRRRRKGTIDDGRFYWCRYENAYGKTWETRNPADPTANLNIRRIYFSGMRERREERRARRLQKPGTATDRRLAAETTRKLEEPGAAADAVSNARPDPDTNMRTMVTPDSKTRGPER